MKKNVKKKEFVDFTIETLKYVEKMASLKNETIEGVIIFLCEKGIKTQNSKKIYQKGFKTLSKKETT